MKDASQLTPTAKPTEPSTDAPDAKTPATTTAPEAYTDFRAPEGGKLDPTVIAEATPIFKELGLSQDSAQRLVDFYNQQITKVAGPEVMKAIVEAQNEKFVTALKADPDIGGKLEQVKIDIGRAYDAIGNPKLVAEFKSAMDSSPEGNNPAFVKMFHAMAQRVIEGKAVTGGGPSVAGQTQKPEAAKSLAASMYPHLVGNRG